MNSRSFGLALLSWYQANRRDLPWRESRDPYLIWLSEIILQQTRVEQGTPYFLAFKNRFPKVTDLAQAEEEEVLRLWQGLGYYSRARNLHFTARYIAAQYQGRFPQTYDKILALRGIGPYTAAAISSIAFELPHAAVDGNVIRVLSRIFGLTSPIDDSQTRLQIEKLAQSLLGGHQPSEFNQALMEFGAIQCLPRNPDCGVCIFKNECLAFRESVVDEIPAKSKKIKRRTRYFHFIVNTMGNKAELQQRKSKDIWQGLFQFPLIETEDEKQLSVSQLSDQLKAGIDQIYRINQTPKHVLSHQDLFATFYHVQLDGKSMVDSSLVPIDELHTFALPRLIDRYLENYEVVEGKKRH